jgi:hypothetical protein
MQRIRHPRNLENGDVRDVLYGYRDELRSCFCLEDDPEVTFDTLSAFEKYHLKGLGIELKGGGNGWKTCEVEVGGIWIKAHVHHERINNRVQVETKDGGPSC